MKLLFQEVAIREVVTPGRTELVLRQRRSLRRPLRWTSILWPLWIPAAFHPYPALQRLPIQLAEDQVAVEGLLVRLPQPWPSLAQLLVQVPPTLGPGATVVVAPDRGLAVGP